MDLTVFCSFVQYLVAPRRPVTKAVIKNPFVADSISKESFCGGQQQFFPPAGEFFCFLIWGVSAVSYLGLGVQGSTLAESKKC